MTIITLFDKIFTSKVYLPMGVIMNKFKLSILILGFVLCLSAVSQARVCFLGGGNDFDGDGILDDACLGNNFVPLTNCPGYTFCDTPPSSADTCKEGGMVLYKPEDCCSNTNYWVPCDESLGYVCTGATCSGTNAKGEDHTTCQQGKCVCDSAYNKECSAADGLVGVGVSCGGKYKECKCNRDKYYKCGDNATGSGKCTDAEGDWYAQCICPATGKNNWVSDADDCCVGVEDNCTSQPNNVMQYKCYDNLNAITLECKCGVTYQENKSSCVNGCSDSQYSFIGNDPLISCQSSVMGIGDNLGGFCGNNCTCIDGYFDYEQLCEKQNDEICAELGYIDTVCSDNYVACPFDSAAKLCLECEYKTLADCQSSFSNAMCASNSLGCYAVAGCKPGYKLSSDGKSCVENTCQGYVSCSEGLYGKGDVCVNSKGTFYQTCEVAETCYGVYKGDVAYRNDKGSCELVLTAADAQAYLNNGYYEVEKCQPIDAEQEKLVRLHSCESEEPDCAGNYSPVKGLPVATCLNANDGTSITCGGKTFASNCKCNNENDSASQSLCNVYEITAGMKKGDVVGSYVFTGNVKTGCDGFAKQYGYFTSIVSNQDHCKGGGAVLFEGAVDSCGKLYEEVCPSGHELYTSNDGSWVHCSTECVKATSPCDQYNNAEYTGNENCYVFESGKSKYKKVEVGIVPETKNSSTKCAFYAECGSEAYCSKFGYNEVTVPDGYEAVLETVIPEGSDVKVCGSGFYSTYINVSPCPYATDGCSLTNKSTLFETKLANGNYQVSVSGAPQGCYYYASCDATGTDCAGNKSPIYNRVTVEGCASTGGFATNYVECGGQSYPTKCATTCDYDDTETDCAALGKSFVLKCVKDDETGSFRLGQCV